MADIRIKDLTTTASSTASDDFIAVDGTTNGTRKLNAFSPTFGGNATVTGTLTANGLLTAAATTSLDGLPTAAIFGATKRIAIGYNTSGDYGFIASADSGTTWKELHLNPSGGLVKVPSTSASTTTSTGALVVGNGTSGGLGVGGSINTGGTLRFHTNANLPGVGSIGISATYGLNMYASTGSSYDFTVFNAAGSSLILNPTGTQNLTLPGVITLSSSTASTSTSSGALVVSGGVGVAGAVFTGGYVHPGGDSTFYIRGTGSNNGLIRGNVTSVDVDTSFGVRNGDGSSTYLSVASTGLIAAIPATAPSLTVNGTMTFERTSNTSLKISVRGTDGTTRSVSLTLA
jgi:hypothetical protein